MRGGREREFLPLSLLLSFSPSLLPSFPHFVSPPFLSYPALSSSLTGLALALTSLDVLPTRGRPLNTMIIITADVLLHSPEHQLLSPSQPSYGRAALRTWGNKPQRGRAERMERKKGKKMAKDQGSTG